MTWENPSFLTPHFCFGLFNECVLRMDEMAITFQGAVLGIGLPGVFRSVIYLTRTHWAPSNTNRFCLHKVEFNPGQETKYTFAQRARAEILHRVFKLNKGFKTQREVLLFCLLFGARLP